MSGSFGGDGGRFSFFDLILFLTIVKKRIGNNNAKSVKRKGCELKMICSIIILREFTLSFDQLLVLFDLTKASIYTK